MLHKLNKNELIGFYSVVCLKGDEQGVSTEVEPGKLRSYSVANKEGYDTLVPYVSVSGVSFEEMAVKMVQGIIKVATFAAKIDEVEFKEKVRKLL